MSGRKSVKLTIESYDETYYPVVAIKTASAVGGASNESTNEKLEHPEEVSRSGATDEAAHLVELAEGDHVGETACLAEATRDENSNESAQSAENDKVTVLIDVVRKQTPRRGRRELRVWWSRLATLVVVMIATVAVALVGVRLAGFRTFTVMSGSMEPSYPIGSMIYVRPINYQDLKVGDVISYVAGDDKTVVTHRIVGIEVDEKDVSVWRFKTKGDANVSADTKLVHYKNVLGTPIITIPHIGYLAHNIQEPPGIYITLVVGTLLLAWTFLPGTLEGRRKMREEV